MQSHFGVRSCSETWRPGFVFPCSNSINAHDKKVLGSCPARIANTNESTSKRGAPRRNICTLSSSNIFGLVRRKGALLLEFEPFPPFFIWLSCQHYKRNSVHQAVHNTLWLGRVHSQIRKGKYTGYDCDLWRRRTMISAAISMPKYPGVLPPPPGFTPDIHFKQSGLNFAHRQRASWPRLSLFCCESMRSTSLQQRITLMTVS